MPWDELNVGPLPFNPAEASFNLDLPWEPLVQTLHAMGVEIERHGVDGAVILTIDGCPMDPVQLPKIVQGHLGLPSLQKMLKNTTLDWLDVVLEVARLVNASGAAQPAPTRPAPIEEGGESGGSTVG